MAVVHATDAGGGALVGLFFESSDVAVPVKRGDLSVKLRLRTVAKPEADVAVLLSHLGLRLPSRSKVIQNVVEKNS